MSENTMIYFFNTRLGERFVRDEEGSDFPNVDVARSEAVLAAREMMADAILRGKDISDSVFEIADETQTIVMELPFRDVVRRMA